MKPRDAALLRDKIRGTGLNPTSSDINILKIPPPTHPTSQVVLGYCVQWMPFTLSTLELSGCPTHDCRAPFKIMHTLIKIQIFRVWAGQKWWCLEELPWSHWGHQQDTSLKQQMLPRDREIWVRFSLQTTKFYFNSLQSLEHVQEFTAVSADVLSPPPWLYTSFKNKMTLFLGI